MRFKGTNGITKYSKTELPTQLEGKTVRTDTSFKACKPTKRMAIIKWKADPRGNVKECP